MTGVAGSSEVLFFEDRTFIDFEVGTCRWIDVKRFSVTQATASNLATLEALPGHRQYRDDYASSESRSDSGVEHGPYYASHITTSRFEECDAARGEETLLEFNNLYGVPPSSEVDLKLVASVFEPLASASAIFELLDLDGVQHEFGDVLLEFRELVVIIADRRNVLLLVAAID